MRIQTTKACTKCGVEKPLDEFHRWSRSSDGRKSQCKACRVETSRAYYAANREREAGKSRAWRKANPEKSAELGRAWAKANPDKVAEIQARMRAKYPERYLARLEVCKAVLRGDFPPPSALVCDYCQEAQAEHYHHHIGYEPEHALDVIAVCLPCHVELHKEAA